MYKHRLYYIKTMTVSFIDLLFTCLRLSLSRNHWFIDFYAQKKFVLKNKWLFIYLLILQLLTWIFLLMINQHKNPSDIIKILKSRYFKNRFIHTSEDNFMITKYGKDFNLVDFFPSLSLSKMFVLNSKVWLFKILSYALSP